VRKGISLCVQRHGCDREGAGAHLWPDGSRHPAHLPAVDVEEDAVVAAKRPKVKRHAGVVPIGQDKVERRAEEADARSVERRRGHRLVPGRVVETGQVPALTLTEETTLVKDAPDPVGEGNLTAPVALDLPRRK
jgi:hypothetical protein